MFTSARPDNPAAETRRRWSGVFRGGTGRDTRCGRIRDPQGETETGGARRWHGRRQEKTAAASAEAMIELTADLCIIGAGSAGLTAASIAAQLRSRVVLIERAKMGGECLNTGCVRSKALLAAAKAAHAIRNSPRFGVVAGEPRVEFEAVRAHVKGVIASIAPHDSVERFEGLGVQVLNAEARFVEPRVLVAGEHRI